MIVIPMAGQSSRFLKAGYSKPKYQLEINHKPLFDYCISSFEYYFHTECFIFIVRSCDEKNFVETRCKVLGVQKYRVEVLSALTRGQAETVYLGIKGSKKLDDNLIIFNIDTIRHGYRIPEMDDDVMGYLEVFEGEGEGWSFVEPILGTNKVARTTEKVRISTLCSTGLYFFKRVDLFNEFFEKFSEIETSSLQGGEYYVAPMYNLLIEASMNITFHQIGLDDVIFSGIPSEYEAILNNPKLLF
ncbi:capsular biosynthesis protein [Pseudomonas sp. HK3]